MNARAPVIAPDQALDFLNRASTVLAASLDYDETLQRVTQLAVPELADWCAVLIDVPEGTQHEITSVHPDAEVEELILDIRRRRRETRGASESLQVVQSGHSVLVSDARAPVVEDLGSEERAALTRLAPQAYMIVPLLARGRVIGALTLLSTTEGRNYTESDTRFAETLAVRFALAIDNARLFQAEREARTRADFLARAGTILDGSLDYGETLANVAQIAVPDIADWCAVSILDDYGNLREVAAAHSDPAKRAAGRELSERFPPDPASTTGTVGVARTGKTEFVPEITDEMLVAGIPDPEQLGLVRALDLSSAIITPLIARGRSLGTLTFASAESGRLFTPADVQFAEELARRAGTAIENARLYTERTRIAHALQARLLPSSLPAIPGVELAARYRAAGELIEVGGDFYDAFERSDSSWACLVGDVSGKGAEAAAITALARYTLRAVVPDAAHPSAALKRLNDAMISERLTQFATVVLVFLSPRADGAVEVELALGGHPPALVLHADGTVEPLGRFGGLLGAHPDPPLDDSRCTLQPGESLVLYTDGVTEAGPRLDPIGQDGLVALLANARGGGPDEIVDVVERAVLDAHQGEPRDDLAVLALRVSPEAAR